MRTSIFKQPVAGPVAVHAEHLAGDGQADLRVHGGRDKAVYAYPQEHHAYWRAYLPPAQLVPGGFGENLTTTGLLEDQGARGRPVPSRHGRAAGRAAPPARALSSIFACSK